MPPAHVDRAAAFLSMHQSGKGFIIPNAWDAGSARLLEQAGFAAIATTSAGISFAAGRPDGALGRSEMLAAVAAIVDAVACPVSADLEAGYGDTPDDVAGTVAAAAAAGVVGANLEDCADGVQFGVGVAAERIAAARSAAAVGTFVINARIDSLLVDRGRRAPGDVLADVVERASAYAAAGADCVFVPGVDDPDVIARLVEHLPVPLNVVVGLTPRLNDAATLFGVGVTRISVGGSLARAALAVVQRAATDLLERGRFDFAATALAHADVQQAFADPS
ncbi:MAG TPA: isocitrate lyase/phosphoenolpyruvate mutase family protein [Ilumatobacter sp.]|nr:isocitrate lyase/phosphoenolpyruvate mutase family protein [Ilumatobacter sp.]